MPPVCSQRAPSLPKMASQSIVAGPQLRHGRVAAVGAADGRAHAEAALREVEAVPRAAADAVVRHEAHVAEVDAALQQQVLEQPADRVVDECRDDGGSQPEAAAQAAGHVVFAPALPHPKRARGVDPGVAGVEAQHHFAQAHEVEAAFGGGSQRQAHRRILSNASLRVKIPLARPIPRGEHPATVFERFGWRW